MSDSIPNLAVRMIREHLEEIPQFALGGPFTFRWYEKGDETHWFNIHVEADKYSKITGELFREQFGENMALLGSRQVYLCDGMGQPVGTATAWFDENYDGQRFGRVHWVAIVPRLQGQGLGKPLLTCVMNRLRDLSYTRAHLWTSTARIPAIRLYKRFSFVPDIRTPKDQEAWDRVFGHIRF